MSHRAHDDVPLEQVALPQRRHRVHQVCPVQVPVARPHLGGGVWWWCGGVVVWWWWRGGGGVVTWGGGGATPRYFAYSSP